MVNLSTSLRVLGLLHMVNNATKDLRSMMGHWGEWIPQLREVRSLLRWRHSRERPVATGFGDGPAAAFAHLPTAFKGQ
eukprot:4374056-Alexandrium_andersonii.AAC.1